MKEDIPADQVIAFTCNICRQRNSQLAGQFHRESQNCSGCGSTPRFRGIVHALSKGLMKSSVPLPEFERDHNIKGIGMSEWDGYARILSEKYRFTNTFFHQEPFLDITSNIHWQSYRNTDFLICTEVFEHVLQPLEPGFRNMRRMLKKGGYLVFSTPFFDSPETIEHFPGMVDFTTCKVGDTWVVVSKTSDGSYQVFDKNVVFHGGPGTVLEMRIFGRQSLISQLEEAGFMVDVLDEAVLEIGYYWPQVIDRPEFGFPGEHYIMLCKAV